VGARDTGEVFARAGSADAGSLALRGWVREAGLLERRTGFYVRRIAVTVVLLGAGRTAY
jgi:hypothetical protein